METQTGAEPNSYDVAVRIAKHFEIRTDDHVITLTRANLREVSQHERLDRAFLTELDYNLGFFGLLLAWGQEVFIIGREMDFAPYTGGIAIGGEGAAYDASLEQDSQEQE